ncbi:MAG: sulfotransferase domain-containing protein [Proteobacteria bacterium]|nr:sulfotransferase domain-containing protein [Pseudomonadota bacterium]
MVSDSPMPDAIMAGMSRAGTTFMYHYLQKHPDIFIPTRKEVCFFAHHFGRGLEWYHDFYKEKKREQKTLDICGVYFSTPESLERIYQYNPDIKIVLSIRNPFEWIYSYYEQYSGTFDVPPFKEFLQGCSVEREGETQHIDFSNQIISKTIGNYLKLFKGNVLIYDFSYFEEDPLAVLNKIETFLGVSNYFNETNFQNHKINARGRKRVSWFAKLLHVKGVVDLILKLFPRRLILAIREKLEQNAVKNLNVKQVKAKEYSSEEKALVQEIFQADHDYIRQLFEDARIFVV